jgi:hypothetical protein
LLRGQGDRFRAASLSQAVMAQAHPAPKAYGRAAAQVGQGKSVHPVPAIRCAYYGKERLVVPDTQRLPIAKRPISWGKVAPKDPDFPDKWIRHWNFLLILILIPVQKTAC